jgi:hypothetical protein
LSSEGCNEAFLLKLRVGDRIGLEQRRYRRGGTCENRSDRDGFGGYIGEAWRSSAIAFASVCALLQMRPQRRWLARSRATRGLQAFAMRPRMPTLWCRRRPMRRTPTRTHSPDNRLSRGIVGPYSRPTSGLENELTDVIIIVHARNCQSRHRRTWVGAIFPAVHSATRCPVLSSCDNDHPSLHSAWRI